MAPGKQMDKRMETVLIEDARIIFRNFSGEEGQYNRAGDRNFGVVLPDDIAAAMEKDGWNIKYLKPREADELPTPWVPVSVSYKGRPPRCVMITTRYNADGTDEQVRTTLPEDLIMMLDYADLSSVDLVLNPYQWNVNGNTGVKAYLKSIFATVAQDELEKKYGSLKEISYDGSHLQIEGAGPEWDEDIVDADVIDEDEQKQIEA